MTIIPSATLIEEMKTKIEPMLYQLRESGVLQLPDAKEGEGLYYDHYHTKNARGVIVCCHGFTESAEKFLEIIYYMVTEGYEVYAVDHRGHGRSYRQAKHPNLVTVHDFYDYIDDLHLLITKIVQPATQLPLYLFGHSMGGGIVAGYVEQHPDVCRKAVLSSPMLKLTFSMPVPIVTLISAFNCLIGRIDSFGPNQKPYAGYEPFEFSASSNEERFRYYQEKKASREELQLCACSFGWLYHSIKGIAKIRSAAEGKKVTVPILIERCVSDELIDPTGIDEFAANTPHTTVIDHDRCRHEIYNSDDDVIAAYYNEIFEFLS